VRAGDRLVAIGAGKRRALLAALLMEANSPVPLDRLIDELWGARPPATAAKNVQVLVSGLRKSFAVARDSPISTVGSGYMLRVAAGETDADVFEELFERGRTELAHGDPGHAERTLTEALALWRGRPYEDVAYEDFARHEIARLDERRLAAVEERFEALLAAGRHRDAVPDLERLAAEQPLRERVLGQLMLALSRSGRRAEALATYDRARHRMAEELGIEPGDALRRLHAAILESDSGDRGRPIVAVEPTLAERGTDFVGREAELSELVAALGDALAGRGRLVLLGGEPGIGKSRLAEELTSRAKARGARVLVGRCWEEGGAPAYWPWVQSLRSYLRDHSPEVLRAHLGSGGADVAQMLPELRDLLPGMPPPAIESEGARFRLFDSTAAFLRNASKAQPLVLVLDDLHAADAPSLLLLRFVARELRESHVLIVGAYRTVDPVASDPLTTTLAELAREPVTRVVLLAGLGESDVVEFIQLATTRPAAVGMASAVYRETEGNPLFIGEIVRLLAAEGRLDDAAMIGRQFTIPESVRGVIGRRLRDLPAECNQVLTIASVLGREFDLAVLARVAGIPRDHLLEALDEAIAVRVLSEVPGATGRLRFAHALIRDVAYEELKSGLRVRLHRQVAEALEDLYGTDAAPHLAELAHHFVEAAVVGDTHEAVAYARRAGERAAGLLAYEEAARYFLMALRLLGRDTTATAEDRCELLLALGDTQARAGETAASKQAFREAAELARVDGLPEHLARAALGYGGRIIWDVSRDDDYLASVLQAALAALGDEDSTLRVRLLTRLAAGPYRDASYAAATRATLSQEALEMARRIGDPGTLAYALTGYMTSRHSPSFTPEQLEVATELVRVTEAAGDRERAVEAHEARFLTLVELGEMSQARSELAAMAKLAHALRQPSQGWVVAVHRALLALLEGRLAEAEELVAEALKMGERTQSWSTTVSYRLQLYVLRREQGRLEEVQQIVRASVQEYPTYPIWRCVLAQTAAELGQEAEAREAFDALAADHFAGLLFDEEWLVSVSLLAETASALDDGDAAAALHALLLPYADRVAVSYPEISIGSVSRYLGMLAATLSRWDEAARHFETALAINERMGAHPWLAFTQEDYARMLVGRGERARSRQLLDASLAAYRHLGMERHAARAEALDRSHARARRARGT
jgi:DNA-binding SARP family transcriptional activator